jgi:hypothetical protein
MPPPQGVVSSVVRWLKGLWWVEGNLPMLLQILLDVAQLNGNLGQSGLEMHGIQVEPLDGWRLPIEICQENYSRPQVLGKKWNPPTAPQLCH